MASLQQELAEAGFTTGGGGGGGGGGNAAEQQQRQAEQEAARNAMLKQILTSEAKERRAWQRPCCSPWRQGGTPPCPLVASSNKYGNIPEIIEHAHPRAPFPAPLNS